MSFEYLAKFTAENEGDPYLACKGGYSYIVGYRDCANCPRGECDIVQLEKARSTMDEIILQSIKSGAAKSEDYYCDEFGHLVPTAAAIRRANQKEAKDFFMRIFNKFKKFFSS